MHQMSHSIVELLDHKRHDSLRLHSFQHECVHALWCVSVLHLLCTWYITKGRYISLYKFVSFT